MGENDRIQKKSGEKKPATFRIDPETADKLRELCRGFDNQDVALNAIMNAYEREALAVSQPQYTQDMRQFEQYQQCLSAKFTDIIKALGTADERARIEVQKLLDSKDNVIQDLQKRVEDAVRSREAYESMLRDASREKKELEEKLGEERLINQGLSAEMKEKEVQMNSSLSDKIQLNDMLSKVLAEKEAELARQEDYPGILAEKEKLLQEMEERIHAMEKEIRDTEYANKLALFEKEKEAEKERSELRRKNEEQADRMREKYEAELSKLRGKNEEAQARIQELMARIAGE
nr:hypothetical protein [uncultured Acetatifactor sp.]